MSPSSRKLAQSWPYPRHRKFVKEVRSSASNWFESKGYEVSKKYSYILSDWNNWPQNIILPKVTTYIQRSAESQRQEGLHFPLHKYIHHGLSSQAMVFNLVGPMLVQEDLSPLKIVLERKGVTWPGERSKAMFEYEDRSIFNEDSGQPTSIDLVILDQNSTPKIFIESKFVEQEFGGCSVFSAGDCDGRNPVNDLDLCYLHHIGRKYWDLMKKYQIDDELIGNNSICAFTCYYQFFREALFAFEHDGIFVLLCDERSPVFYSDGPKGPRGLMPFLLNLLPEYLRDKVAHVTVQELVSELKSTEDHEWVSEFEEKYGIVEIER